MVDLVGSAEISQILNFLGNISVWLVYSCEFFVSVLLIDLDRSNDDIKLQILIQVNVYVKKSLGCSRVI